MLLFRNIIHVGIHSGENADCDQCCDYLAASIGVGFLGLARLGVLLDTLREIGNGIRIRHVYLAALFKMAGITYIAEFTSGICKDAGYSAVGTQVEMVGKLAILAVSAPVVLSLVETLKVFME